MLLKFGFSPTKSRASSVRNSFNGTFLTIRLKNFYLNANLSVCYTLTLRKVECDY